MRTPGDWDRALGEARAAFKRAEAIASQNPSLVSSAMSARMSQTRITLADDSKDRRFADRVDEIRLGVSETYVDDGEFATFQKEDAFPKLRDEIEEYFGLTFGAAKDVVLQMIGKRPPPIQEILINTLSECKRAAPKGEQAGDCLADFGDRRGRYGSLAGAGACRGGGARLGCARANAHGRASRKSTSRPIAEAGGACACRGTSCKNQFITAHSNRPSR